MSSTTSVYINVNGQYTPYNAQYEYTSGDVANAWGSAVSPFVSLFNQINTSTNVSGNLPATQISASQVSAAQQAIEQLLTLAQTGITSSSTDDQGNVTSKTSYMTYTMAQDLNQLLISLQSAGITVTPTQAFQTNANGSYVLDPNGNPIPLSTSSSGYLYSAGNVNANTLAVWTDLASSTPTVSQLLQSAQNEAADGAQTLQSLVEIDYVQAGNEVLTNQLTSLQQQMNSTQGILSSSFSSIFNFANGRPATVPNFSLGYVQQPTQLASGEAGPAYPSFYNSLAGQPQGAPTVLGGVTVYTNLGQANGTVTPFIQEYYHPANGVFPGYVNGFFAPGVTVVYKATGASITLPSQFATQIPGHFISLIAEGKLAIYGIPAMGIASARIVAYAGLPTTINAGDGFQGFVTVSTIYSQLPANLQTLYANNQTALIARDLVLKPTLFTASGVGGITRPSAGKTAPTADNINATYEAIYGMKASAYFGQPVIPALMSSIIFNVSTFTSYKNQLVTLRTNIVSDMTALRAILTPSQISDPNGLYSQLGIVLSDIQNNFVTPSGQPIQLSTVYVDAYAGFRNWMLDNYQHYNDSLSQNQGLFQTHITSAITAGSATNDTQKQQVQQAIYVFEEFYQSAANILQSLTQIISQMAQNISR
jgi:hypothetical protein